MGNGVVLICMCAVLLSGVANTSSAREPQRSGRAAWWNNDEIRVALELTPEQAAKIDEIEADFAPRIRSMVKAMGAEYQAMQTLLNRADYSREDFQQQQSKLAESYAAHAAEIAAHWDALRQVLNRQQWTKLSEQAPTIFRLGGWKSTTVRRTVKLGSDAKPEAGTKK